MRLADFQPEWVIKADSPFRYFHSSSDVIRLAVMLYVHHPLSLRNVEDLIFERGYDLCHETVRLWWNRFGPMFAADIRRQVAIGLTPPTGGHMATHRIPALHFLAAGMRQRNVIRL